MLTQEPYQKACQEAIGSNITVYTSKVKQIKEKWAHQSDSTPARLMGNLLSSNIPPLYHSIVADNVEYFRKNYDITKVNSNELLAIACLCGSQKVADFLLKKLNLNYLSPGYEYILTYAATSNNIDWVKKIAEVMSQDQKEIPKDLAAFADFSVINTIEEIFERGKQLGSSNHI